LSAFTTWCLIVPVVMCSGNLIRELLQRGDSFRLGSPARGCGNLPGRRGAAYLPPVQRQGPEREIRRVEMVAQVEDPRKPGAGPVLVLPRPVAPLVSQQVVEAAADRLRVPVSQRKETEQCPCRLGRRARPDSLARGSAVGAW